VSSRFLKKVRVFVSILFLFAFSLTFLDFRRILPEDLINTITWLQFIPSLLKFINVFTLGAAGFIVVVILTLLFGRVYCSTICPLGILQDVFTWLSRKLKKKKRSHYKFSKAWTKLRYGILIVTILFFVFGSIFFINLLDPYSNFGRIFTFFGKPVVLELNNLVSNILGRVNVYSIFPVEFKTIAFRVLAFQAGMLAVIVWMATFHGRIYCNTLCPVGTFLGFISKFSLFRIRIDESTCTHCGLCGIVCKSSCLNTEDQKIDLSRCVTCFNCIGVCASHSVVYGLPEKWARKKTLDEKLTKPDFSKRKFIFGTLAFGLGMAGISRTRQIPERKNTVSDDSTKVVPVNAEPTTIPEDKEFPVCPPGATSIEMFNDRCTACNLCVSACPSDVLQPSFLQYGLIGIMQPRMDYWTGFCNFECVRCMEVCPTGALLPIELETKKLTQLGKANFIKENCIVHTDKTDCGACSEHCPTKAVKMVPYEGSLVIPEVEEKICIGCGACEFACPTTPYKAIYVDGNLEHILAEKPKVEELINPMEDEEDFPF